MKKLIILAFAFGTLFLTGCAPVARMNANNDIIRAEAYAAIALINANALMEAEIANAEAEILRATAHAEAEVIRAQGVADAMYIVNDAITPMYLHHFWIRTMAEHGNTVYIATEAGLPIFSTHGME